MGYPIDITGKQFGYYTAIRFSHKINRRHYWICACKCGTVRPVNKSKLSNGEIKSCGCKRKTEVSVNRIHGMSKTRFYGIWNDMMMRCYNPNRERYKIYGGRGITVEKRWRVFNNFKEDMFDSYQKGLSLERINVNKGYSRKNCKWIPILDQSLNRRNTITLIIDGDKMTIGQASKKYGIKYRTIYDRKKSGLSDKDCIKPLRT